MASVDSYDHQPGVHCGAAALRNVTAFYGWNYGEAVCFGIGGGPAFVRYDVPERPWATFRASPPWLERAFFERLGVPHLFQTGDDFETAWAEVTARIDEDDPVILFLDPAALDYLPDGPAHVPPHVAVLVGYDDETAMLSDGALETRQAVSLATLSEAWSSDRFVPLDNEYLVVTRARRTTDDTDAAAAGLRAAATYLLDPLQVKRDARGPGQEGLPALRSFADALSTWPDLLAPTEPVRAARRSIDEHGDGSAFRGLYAESLDALGQRTNLPGTLADDMVAIGREWETVAARLDEILAADDPDSVTFQEAATFVGDIADREEALFGTLADELGAAGGHE